LYGRRGSSLVVSMSHPLRVLSIDGGGIRGIVPALILAEIERRAGKPAASLFDLIAGTSTGAILAAGLTVGSKHPRYSAADLVHIFDADGSTIFHSNRLTRARTLARAKYSPTGIESVLQKYFGNARLADAITPVLIPSYEIERRIPWFFRSEKARKDPKYDFPIWQVARCSSAAPVYFPPMKIDGDCDYHALIDGGIFANNPAMCAYTEARLMAPDREVLMVSLGTGEITRPISHARAATWGAAFWLSPLLDCMFDGASGTTHYQVRHLAQHYWRFQPELAPENQAIDDVKPRNLRELRLTAERHIRERSADIDAICAAL